jgi:hypothetical protein
MARCKTLDLPEERMATSQESCGVVGGGGFNLQISSHGIGLELGNPGYPPPAYIPVPYAQPTRAWHDTTYMDCHPPVVHHHPHMEYAPRHYEPYRPAW